MLNSDGSYTSHFSYNNTTASELTIVNDDAAGTINQIIPESEGLTAPTLFKPGTVRGAVAFTHRSESLTWVVQAQGAEQSSATTNSLSRSCAAIVPLADCDNTAGSGISSVVIGYENPNPFSMTIPVGPLNTLSAGATSSAQPTEFLPGLNKGVAKVTLSDSSSPHTWVLNGKTVALHDTLRSCDGGCANINSADVIKNLDKIALQLSSIAQQTAKAVAKARRGAIHAEISKKLTPKDNLLKVRRDTVRTSKRAKTLEEEAYRLTINLPAVTKSCPNAPQYCESIDRWNTIGALRGLYAHLVNLTKRQTARFFFVEIGETKRNRARVVRAKKLEKLGNAQLDKLPRFATECA